MQLLQHSTEGEVTDTGNGEHWIWWSGWSPKLWRAPPAWRRRPLPMILEGDGLLLPSPLFTDKLCFFYVDFSLEKSIQTK